MDNKKLNFWECMSFCIGQIVGSGVFVLTGIVIGLTGHGAPYGFVLRCMPAGSNGNSGIQYAGNRRQLRVC